MGPRWSLGRRRLVVALLMTGLVAGMWPSAALGTIGVPAAAALMAADTNVADGTGAWTLVPKMSIVSSAGSLKAGTVIFEVQDPAAFELACCGGGLPGPPSFKLEGSGCGSLSLPGSTFTATDITLYLTGASGDSCSLTVSALYARPKAPGAAPLETSQIRVRCDTCGFATTRIAATLTVVPGAAGMTFRDAVADVAAGVAIAPAPVVHSEDQYGNPRAGDVFQLVQQTSSGVDSNANCTPQPVTTNAAGDAAFTGCSIATPGRGYRLIGRRLIPPGGSAFAASNPFNVYGAATKLAFAAQPNGGVTGQPFPLQPVVTVQDALGTTITTGPGSTASVSLFLGPGAPIGASLSCTGGNTQVAVAGIATFSGCSINAATTYTLAATAGTVLLPASSLPFVVTAQGAITLTTSAPIPPGAKDPVILWGQGFDLGVQFAVNGANRSVDLQGSRDGSTWTTIATLTTDPGGHASHRYRPVTNLYYRATFAGAPDLAPGTSNQVRTVVRELAVMRPTTDGKIRSIRTGTEIIFTTTVRPSRPELTPASVTFTFSRQVASTRLEVTRRTIVVDATGAARTTFTFAVSGRWFVRSQANPTPYNANSVSTPLETYDVG